MKKVLFFVLILVFSSNIFAQNASANFDLTNYGVRIEPDKRLIAVLASLEVAEIETPLTAKGVKFRQQLRADLQTLNPELRQKIKTFVDQYKRRHPNQSQAELISPFVSMAYSLSPAPDLSDPTRTTDLPGDLLEVLDYAPLVREFYRRLTVAKIDEYVKIYQIEDAQLRRSAVEMVSELLDYLHTKPQLSFIERIKTESQPAKNKKSTIQKTEVRERARRFFIVPEMLAPKGTVNFLNIADDYFAVVPVGTDLSKSEVRRAYLQFVLDPLVLNNAKDIFASNEGIKKLLADLKQSMFAKEKAKNKDLRIEDITLSPDAFLAVSRSLVSAVDAREIEYKKTQFATAQARRNIDLMKTDAEKRKVSAELDSYKKSLADETALQLSEAYEKGAVLSFYFAEQLKGLENSGFDIASSFREMILSLDAAKEANRYAQFADARQRAIAARAARKNAGDVEIVTIENPTTKKLLDIEKIIQAKGYGQAEIQLKQLLEANPNDAPRIYYALGRNASLSAEGASEVETRQRLLDAKVAYENVIRSATAKIDSVSAADLININSPNKDTANTARALISLSYVGLARIYEHYGESEYAVKIYEAAIKIGDVPNSAYKEAVEARERLLKNSNNI